MVLQSFDERLMNDFPKKPSYRSDWRTIHWQKGPLAIPHRKHRDFALETGGAPPDIERRLRNIKVALQQESTYYAMFSSDSPESEYVGNIDFFIVDLNASRIYIINHNT